MLTWLLLILVIGMNIETKSIILCDSHSMEEIIADNNRNKNTHWLLTEIDNFYKSTMELYVVTSIISENLRHVLYMCFCNPINIYRYVYNYPWKTTIISKFYYIFQWIRTLHLYFLDFARYFIKNNQFCSLENKNI